jgi:hypothetical protein
MEQTPLYDFLMARGLQNFLNENWWIGAAGSGGTSGVLMNDDYRKAFGSVTAYRCPTRRGGGSLIVNNGLTAGDTHSSCRPGPQTDYAFVCLGPASADGTPNWCYVIYNDESAPQTMRGPFRASIGGSAAQWRPRDSFTRILDGTSNQFFVGEKHISLDNLGRCNKSTDTSSPYVYIFPGDCSYLGGTLGTLYQTPAMARATVMWESDGSASLYPLAISPTDRPTSTAIRSGFGSYHPGICQFLFGDGAVRGVSVTTPVEPILLPFSDVADGKTVTLD